MYSLDIYLSFKIGVALKFIMVDELLSFEDCDSI